MLGSVGVIISALVIMFTGWTLADPIVGAAIGIFIVPRTWALLSQSVNILLEGTPVGMDLSKLNAGLRRIAGVVDVHDTHVWTITSGYDAMSCHLIVADGVDEQEILVAARELLHQSFGIDHVTIQIETSAINGNENRSQI